MPHGLRGWSVTSSTTTCGRPWEPQTSAFAARAKAIGEAMTAAGYALPDGELVMSLLASLPEDYDMLVTTLTMRGGELSLGEVQTALLQYEQQLLARKARDEESSASSSKRAAAKAYGVPQEAAR